MDIIFETAPFGRALTEKISQSYHVHYWLRRHTKINSICEGTGNMNLTYLRKTDRHLSDNYINQIYYIGWFIYTVYFLISVSILRPSACAILRFSLSLAYCIVFFEIRNIYQYYEPSVDHRIAQTKASHRRISFRFFLVLGFMNKEKTLPNLKQ